MQENSDQNITKNEQSQDQSQDQTKDQEPKTYTQEEVDKLLQIQTDKRVSSAIEKSKAKWKAEYEEKLKQEREQAERLAKMTSEERFQAELDKQKKEFEAEKKQFLKERNLLEATKELEKNGLPISFAQYVVADNSEKLADNIDLFKSEYSKAIEQTVDGKLKGNTPRTSTRKAEIVTKEQFKKMDYAQRLELFHSNRELYNQLSGK